MCDRCDGENLTPPEVPQRHTVRSARAESGSVTWRDSRFVPSRRTFLLMGCGATAGFALSLINCRPESAPATSASAGKSKPPALASSLPTSRSAAPMTRESPEASAIDTARAIPANPAMTSAAATRGVAPPMGKEIFPDAAGYPLAKASEAPVAIIPRTDWTTAHPDLAHIDLMNGVSRLTVHHTAGEIETDAWLPTAREMENIRAFHAGTRPGDRQWADIAYHFAVDRAGRVWQARPLAYQGAHARGNNEHNLGIVVLGNFEVQSATAAQLRALIEFISFVRGIYNIPLTQVFTHGELVETACPGRYLQDFMTRARTNWALKEHVAWVPQSRPASQPAAAPTTRGRGR